MSVMIWEGGSRKLITENLDIGFANATSSPLNTSKPAFSDHFRTLRFSDTGGGVFLLVSYGATLDAERAETYADDVFGEFRKIFNLPLAVTEKTHAVNNETATIDIYYQLSGTAWNVDSFEELANYRPPDGLGQLINRSLLSFYLRSDFIPGTIVNKCGIYSLEYNLTRTSLGYSWNFLLSVGYQVGYDDVGHIDVSLNELLNHSGPITPSTQRSSQVTITFLRRQLTRETPLCLILKSSSPPYTDLKEEKARITDLNEETTKTELIYSLTSPADDISVIFNVAVEKDSGLIPVIIIIPTACMILVAVLVFVRARRRKLKKNGR